MKYKKQFMSAAAGVLCATAACAAGDPEFIGFAVKAAHKAGFQGCDAGIRGAFSEAAGKDIRVVTDKHPQAPDQLQMTAIYGDPGDVVQLQLVLRKSAGTCVVHQWSSTISAGHCGDWLSQNDRWRHVATSAGVMFAQNAGGVQAILRPSNGMCLITYSRLNVY